jgi:hypothetical protein
VEGDYSFGANLMRRDAVQLCQAAATAPTNWYGFALDLLAMVPFIGPEAKIAGTGERIAVNGEKIAAEVAEVESKVPAALKAGQAWEAEQIAQSGGTLVKNTSVFRPTAEAVETATFKAIVGEAEYTKGGKLVGTAVDATTANGGSLVEFKNGTSELVSTYQLRLQTYQAVTEGKSLTIVTTRPVNPEFQKWLEFWGVNIVKK